MEKAISFLAITVVVSILTTQVRAHGGNHTHDAIPDIKGKLTWIEHPSAGFMISATEIPVEAYLECFQAGKCALKDVGLREHRGDCTFSVESPRLGYPLNCVDYNGAASVCSWLGGRICSEKEWNSACAGMSGDRREYSYGREFVDGACLVGAYADGNTLQPIGSHPECKGGLDGLYDMGGSLSEWLAEGSGTYRKFKPISYAFNGPKSKPVCVSMCAGNQVDFQSPSIGARCCMSLESTVVDPLEKRAINEWH